jgi:hypothetical protein
MKRGFRSPRGELKSITTRYSTHVQFETSDANASSCPGPGETDEMLAAYVAGEERCPDLAIQVNVTSDVFMPSHERD